MIQRLLQKEIISLMKQYPAVAILGARQVGKTTLTKQIAALRRDYYMQYENVYKISSGIKINHP
jgi:predicted AAA+ superfamily ATPase